MTATKIKELLGRGWTKYRIAKTLEVSWNTVHLWGRGEHEATKASLEKLETLLNQHQ